MGKYIWKVWLKLNSIAKGTIKDYFAEIVTTGYTVKNTDIARQIVEDGSEIKYDTILHILNQSDHIVFESIQEGSSVETGCFHIMPQIQGYWLETSAHFDPEKHKTVATMNATVEMKETLKDLTIDILGVKDGGYRISQITDVVTGNTNKKITVNGDIILEGTKIKVMPIGEEGIGVFFVAEDGHVIPVTHPLIQNSPRRVIVRVPELERGQHYALKIVTQFIRGNNLLKTPRTIMYDTMLVTE
jgi:hypothetical protein